MSEAAAKEALAQHLQGLVFSPALPIAWPNVAFEPPSDSSYLKVDFLSLPAMRPALANSGSRYIAGLMQVSIFVPVGAGEIEASRLSALVLDWFGRGTKIAGDGVTVEIGSVTGGNGEPREGSAVRQRSSLGGENTQSSWMMLPVTIPWYVVRETAVPGSLVTVWEEDLTQYANQAAAEAADWSFVGQNGGVNTIDATGFLFSLPANNSIGVAQKTVSGVLSEGEYYAIEVDEAMASNCVRVPAIRFPPTIISHVTPSPTAIQVARTLFSAPIADGFLQFGGYGSQYFGGTGAGAWKVTAIRIRRIVGAAQLPVFAG